jgi:cytochrome c oxidase subunit 2
MRKGIALSLALSSLTLLAACNSMSGTVSDNTSSSSSAPAMMESSSSSAESMETSSEAAMPSAEARVIDVAMTDWKFEPASITAKVGEKLVLRVTGVEGKHSIAIADLGINVPVEPGETKDVEIPTDKAGTFQFRCRIPCGPGHMDMTGTLVIS